MTLSSDTITRYTAGEVITMAYQALGVLDGGRSLPAADAANGLLWLRTVLDELPAVSVQARAVTLHDLSLVADQTAPYSLPDAALDVVGDASYIGADDDPAAAENEIYVTQISRERWQHLPDKATTGVPTMFWLDRESFPLQVSFWPWPSEAGTVRFQAQRPIERPTATTDMLDIEQHWCTYLVQRLAYLLAPSKNIPVEERALLAREAANLQRMAKGKSYQGTDIQLVVRRRY